MAAAKVGTAEEKATALALYESGLSTRQVGKRMGRSQAGISKWLRDLNYNARRTPPPPHTPELWAEAVELYDSGWSIRQVGEHLGLKYAMTRNGLIRNGVKLREVGGKYAVNPRITEQSIRKCVVLHEKGLLQCEIAKVLRMSPMAVSVRLRRAGVTRSKRLTRQMTWDRKQNGSPLMRIAAHHAHKNSR